MPGLFHTSVELSPVSFTVGSVTCTKISVGPMDNNAYLLDAGGPLVLIDAADDAQRLLTLIAGRPVAAVVTTHQHHDHVQALAEVVHATGAQAWAGAPDVAAIADQTGIESTPVWSGEQIETAAIKLEVIGLVGHTPGSITLVLRPDVEGVPVHLFTGDSLFPGGVGATRSPSQFTSLLDDVTREIFDRFDDQTVVHPGHGDSTTLGEQRGQLSEWRARGW